MKNISTVKLIAIFAVLILVYFAIDFFGGKERSKSFKAILVEIDTAKVSKVEIDSKGKSLELVRENQRWKTGIGSGKFAPAVSSSVNQMLGSLLRIKPSRLVAKDSKKWKEYQVDSAGTRVRVFEGDKPALDLVIGRFGIQGQREFFTYVRLYDDHEVYAADNFMGISFGTEPADYRNKQLLKLTTDSLTEIQFNYPADSAFSLIKTDNKWTLGSQQVDSAAIAGYFNDIRYINSPKFVDDVPAATLNTPDLSIVFKENNGNEITVNAYRHPTYTWILHTNLNPQSNFSDNAIFKKLVKNKGSFLGAPGK